MGGEKVAFVLMLGGFVGSPPRRRGKGGYVVGGLGCVRITPAWAGKSLFCFTAAVPIQDHPRTCGEKNITKETPTDAEFTTSTNWKLKFDHKNVRMGKITIPKANFAEA